MTLKQIILDCLDGTYVSTRSLQVEEKSRSDSIRELNLPLRAWKIEKGP